MITMKPAQAKNFFFDRKIVQQYMDKKTASALARSGGLIRRIAQNSMRSRKKASQPGSPPSRHRPRGEGLTYIIYAFDPKAKSVVIGPVGFSDQINPDGTTAAQANEFGGRVKLRTKAKSTSKRPQPIKVAATTEANFPQRPFMGPALETAQPKLPQLWASAVQN